MIDDRIYSQYGEDDIDFFDGGPQTRGDEGIHDIFKAALIENGGPSDNYFDRIVTEIDFSQFAGEPFKDSFRRVNKTIARKSAPRRRSLTPLKPLTQQVDVKDRAQIFGTSRQKMGKIIVPDNRPVIVEGMSRFILRDDKEANSIRNTGYYKGRKLNEMLFIFNNSTPHDFVFSLFNPSMPLDFLQSTGQNINDYVQVAGQSAVSYTDVLFNIVGNPIIVRNAKFIISGPNAVSQRSHALQFQDKVANGVSDIIPLNLALQIDNMQVEGNTITFDIAGTLNRPFSPDGMDVMNYTILAGNTVTMCFYYEQKATKKVFYSDARKKRPKTNSV